MPGSSPISGWPIPLDSDPLGDAAGAIIRSLVDAIEAGWTAFTPGWFGSTTNPAIGNGTIVGRYKRIGKTVFFRISITAGTTTTYGSGNYSFGIPFASHATARQMVGGDVVIGSVYGMRGRIDASASIANLWTPGTTAGGGDRNVTPTVPATFVSTAVAVLEGVYEAA